MRGGDTLEVNLIDSPVLGADMAEPGSLTADPGET